MTRDYTRAVEALTAALGTPTDTRPLDSSTRQRRAWTTRPERLMHDTHAVVVLDGRGVVMWASGPGTAFHGRLHTPHMVVAPSPGLATRIERCPTVATVETLHLFMREPWRGPIVRTTLEIAVGVVRALVHGDFAREESP